MSKVRFIKGCADLMKPEGFEHMGGYSENNYAWESADGQFYFTIGNSRYRFDAGDIMELTSDAFRDAYVKKMNKAAGQVICEAA